MIKIKQLLEKSRQISEPFTNKGYSGEQKRRRETIEKSVLRDLKAEFPEVADDLSIVHYRGLGYYSCYSDFAIAYKGETLIGIGTHTHTVEKAPYEAEYDIVAPRGTGGAKYGFDNIDDLSLYEVVKKLRQYRRDCTEQQLLVKIQEKESELAQLKDQLSRLQDVS